MDVRDRALLDLQRVLDVKPPVRPRFDPQEARYLDFKTRVGKLLKEALGDGAQAFLEHYFLEFLPVLIRAAGEHEKLHEIECEQQFQEINEVFDKDLHNLSHSPMIFPLNRQVFRLVAPASPALDLGIGQGQNSQFTLGGRPLDVGADIMVSNLIKARQRKCHKSFVAMDMGNIPFANETFQRVYALNCLYHVQMGRRKALEEISRVLAPGGQVALTDISPFLTDMKPLRQFFESLGFGQLGAEFSRYFLSGFGADGTPGEKEFYTETLMELGFENITARYLLSPRLTQLSYLFYDWQALFNLNAQSKLEGAEGLKRLNATYRPMLKTVVAPLIRLDEELCYREQCGGYLFVTAQKRGTPDPKKTTRFVWDEHLICPTSGAPLTKEGETYVCRESDRAYPVVDGIPLLTDFYADNVEIQTAAPAEEKKTKK
ncbi:MAG: methyltransferase domain-containing protein [Vulcanimicrobiota bacterium]